MIFSGRFTSLTHPSLSQITISISATAWIARSILILQGVALLAFLIMLLSKILEGLIRLFGNVKFADSTHPLDGGLFAAFGGLSSRVKQRRRVRAGKSGSSVGSADKNGATGDHERGAGSGAGAAGVPSKRASQAGSVNTQMMLDRFSSDTQHTAAGPLTASSHHGHTRGSSSGGASGGGYLPSQRPPSGQWSAYAPISGQEILQDDHQPPVRGFSVIRGGKANYQDPYTAFSSLGDPATAEGYQAGYNLQPRTNYVDGRTQPITTIPLSTPSTSATAASTATIPAVASTTRHNRRKSQTAIVESVPSSTSASPQSTYRPLSGSGDNTPGWTTPGAPAGSAAVGIQPFLHSQPFNMQSGEPIEQMVDDDVWSDTSDHYKRDRPTKKSKWFGIGSGKSKAAYYSDDDEDVDEFGVGGHEDDDDDEPDRKSTGGGGGWFASFGLGGGGGEKSTRQSLEERGDENHLRRKSGEAATGAPDDPSAATTTRSFKVVRNKSSSTSKSIPSSLTPITPLESPNESIVKSNNNQGASGQTSPPAPGAPQRSFVVNRAKRPLLQSALTNPHASSSSSGPESPPQQQAPVRTFVVNRQPQRPT